MSDSIKLRSKVHTEDIPDWVFFIDTETVPAKDSDFQEMLCCCFEQWRVDKSGLPRHVSNASKGPKAPFSRGVIRKESDFYDIVKNAGHSRVIAHNWQFDASVLRIGSQETMDEHGYTIDPSNGGIYPVGRSGFSPFWVILRWDNGNTTELICNTNFHKCKLSSLGEAFGYPKKEFPPNTRDLLYAPVDHALGLSLIRTDSSAASLLTTHNPLTNKFIQMVSYCKRDVEILRMSFFYVFRFSKEVAKTTPGFTIAQASMRCYQRGWFRRIPNYVTVIGNKDNEHVNEAEMESYHGGRTECFFRGQPTTKKIINKYDANSMYPSCMLGDLPVAFDRLVSGKKVMDALEQRKKECYLCKVEVNIPNEGLGWLGWEGLKTRDKGLIFPCGNYVLWAWMPMVRIAHANNWIVKVHEGISYRTYPIFNEYILDIYNRRNEAKKNGDAAKSLMYKYLLNSLYGKFGQAEFGEWSEVTALDDWEFQKEHFEEIIWKAYQNGDASKGMVTYWKTRNNLWKYEEAEKTMGKRSVCSIASFITAKARANLLTTMQALYAKGNMIYKCDTDSIMTDGTLPDHLIGDQLGQWKLEETSAPEECEFVAPKHYTFSNHTKCKGARKPQRGVATYEQIQFSKWSTCFLSTRQGTRNVLEKGATIKQVSKTFTGANRKRDCPLENGPTQPLIIQQ